MWWPEGSSLKGFVALRREFYMTAVDLHLCTLIMMICWMCLNLSHSVQASCLLRATSYTNAYMQRHIMSNNICTPVVITTNVHTGEILYLVPLKKTHHQWPVTQSPIGPNPVHFISTAFPLVGHMQSQSKGMWLTLALKEPDRVRQYLQLFLQCYMWSKCSKVEANDILF